MNKLENYHTIAIIGTAKNAGKTTALNAFLQETKSKRICITSIGLDGEKIDQLTKQAKPSILAYKGMLVATATDTLEHITGSYEVLHDTSLPSSLGTIVIVRMKEDGHVLLAGPSSLDHLIRLKVLLTRYELDHFIIDGALFRKSSAASKLADGIILSTGGALSKNMNKVIHETRLLVQLFDLPCVKTTIYSTTCLINKNQSIIEDNGTFLSNPSSLLMQAKDAKELYIKGAITNRLIDALIKHKQLIPPLDIIVSDVTMINCDLSELHKLSLLDHHIKLINHVPLLFLTINPTSPYHSGFDPLIFEQKMTEALPHTSIIDIHRKEFTYE